MPSYFYHLSIEVLRSSHPSTTSASSLALDSAYEALQPFQNRLRPPSSDLPPAANTIQNTPQTHNPPFTLDRRPKYPPINSLTNAPYTYHTTTNTYNPTSTSTSTLTSNTPPRSQSSIASDIRAGVILIECIDMVAPDSSSAKRTPKRGHAPSASTTATAPEHDNLVATGIGTDILGGLRTKGRYIPLDQKVSDSVFGIVHLYRDAQETPYLAGNEDDYPTYLKGSAAAARGTGGLASHLDSQAQGHSQSVLRGEGRGKQIRGPGSDLASYPFPVTASSSVSDGDDDFTTLCILAVPSYLSPSDFLGFVGEKTMDCVAHFRMIRTPRANRYMVLMKFRSGKRAMEWQKEWNGKVFNSMEVSLLRLRFEV